MNVIVRPGVSLADFLAWEREQPQRFEFDGTQPVPMTGSVDLPEIGVAIPLPDLYRV